MAGIAGVQERLLGVALMAMSRVRSWTEQQPTLPTLRRAQRGDERAFSVLVQSHYSLVFNFVLRMVRDRFLAEDLTQEIFLRVFQSLPAFSFRSKFTTWLLQVAKNRVLDELAAQLAGRSVCSR